MSTWEPSEQDVQWLVNLIDKLKIGGIWMAPSYGVIFKKKDANTLALQPPLIANAEAIEMIARTRRVAEKAGIYITEHEAMPILPPIPFEDEPGVFTAFANTPTPIKVTTYKSDKYTAEIIGIVTEGDLKQAELYLEMCPEGNQSKIVDFKGNVLAILRRK